jgi:hypothetical protein
MFFSLFILGLVYFIWRSQHQLYNPPYSPEINTVLFMAGNNRPELEQVLKRYNKNPADSMKRRAVEFLIVNMPGKYSQGYDAPWEDIMAAYMRLDKIPNRQLRLQAHGLGKMVIKEDMKHITAQYLINNIESAFAVWEKQTWGKDIPFDIFCEEILPYRVGTEPLENWREKALADFADLNSLFHAQPEISIQQACSMVNRQLPSFSGRQIANLPSQNYSMLMTSSKGICYEMTTLALFVMRALGIPVAQDFTQTWPGKDVGHQWNSLYLGNGERISFMGAEFAPGVPHSGITLPKSKVYRITFAEQNNIKTKTENIPPEFQNRFIKDVSTEYGAVDVELPVLYSPSPNLSVPKYVYISAMGSADWNLAGWGEMKDQKLVFRALGKNVLYLPVYYADNTKTVAHYPFFINDEGTIRVFKPDTFNLSKVKLTCVTIPNNWYYRMINGFFEGSNKADFSDARVLYTIKDVQQLFNVAKIKNPAKFRYIRYVSPPNSWANVAELEFFGKDKTKLKGTIISSPQRNNDVKQEMAFDDDVLTFFESERNNGGWIGMDMGEKYQIDEIHFIPRNSGDGINLRDTYELYYWDNKGWQLLKSQVATMYDSLYYMSPDNALFCFKNKTKRKGGKVFISQNGEQKWM